MKKIKIPKLVSDYQNKERIILRDFLALVRTTLANERTLFAYIRTSLYLVLGGIGLLQLKDFSHLKWLGYTAIFISLFLIIFGLIRYFKLKSRLQKFYDEKDLESFEKEADKS